MDIHTKVQRSKNMKAIKASGSHIEKILGRALWTDGYRYRKNYAKVVNAEYFFMPIVE